MTYFYLLLGLKISTAKQIHKFTGNFGENFWHMPSGRELAALEYTVRVICR